MGTKRRTLLKGVGVLLLLGIAVFAARSYPWLAMPDASVAQIDQHWGALAKVARPAPFVAKSAASLSKAIDLLRTSRYPYKAVKATERIELDALDAKAAAALEALRGWAANGGLGKEILQCRAGLHVPSILALAKVGFAVAQTVEDGNVRAVLRLSHVLRKSRRLPYAMTGFFLARVFVRWAQSRGVKVSRAALRHHPEPADVYRAVVGDYRCSYRALQARFSGQRFAYSCKTRSPFAPPDVGALPCEFVSTQRELVMYRWYVGRMLSRASAHGGDLASLERALTPPPMDERPQSLVVRRYLLDPSFLGKVRGHLEAYRAAIGR